MKCAYLACLSLALCLPMGCRPDKPERQRNGLVGTVEAGRWARQATPTFVDVDPGTEPSPGKPPSVTILDPNGERLLGQTEWLPSGKLRLWGIIPAMDAFETVPVEARLTDPGAQAAPAFAFREQPGEHLDLLWGDRLVTRLMLAWDPDRRNETYKVFHHVFAPSGDRLITKGAGGKYPHHRGLYLGWNKLKCGDRTYDFWHMKTVTQRFRETVEQVAGPVFGRHTAIIEWLDPDEKPVIEEQRTLVAVAQPEGTLLLEWSTELASKQGDLFLGGDMHHAGFQFRAHNEVTTREQETSYLYPPKGVERPNAPDVPWVAMSYALGDRRYTVAHMNHPDNPADTVYSEKQRKYGRFGAFFTRELKDGETLRLRYRIYVTEGEMPSAEETPSAEEIDARYLDFIDPPKVTVADAT